jgi:hypothetical protein
MRLCTILAALALAALGGCAQGEHNYAGSPGSTYDAARNPPQSRGVVAYEALSPITPHDYGNGGDSAATQ